MSLECILQLRKALQALLVASVADHSINYLVYTGINTSQLMSEVMLFVSGRTELKAIALRIFVPNSGLSLK